MSSGETASGDTQVVSQSVFDSIMKQNKDSTVIEGFDNGDGATLRTLQEGDTGHIDLLSGFDDTHPDAIQTQEIDDQSSSKLSESSPIHYQPNLFPESQRFLGTENRQDGRSTETPHPLRNPLAADTGSSGGVMALSQVFKATQVPSSPLVNRLQSDPMSDRPSPSIPLQNHPLADALTSPFMSMPAKLQRKSSEPQYISMEESQAERDRLLGQRVSRSAEHINPEDQSDGEFDKEPSFIRRLRHQRMINEEASAQFASLSAPMRPSSRSEKDDKLRSSPHNEPETRNQSGSPRVVAQEEPHEDAVNPRGGTSEEETEQEEDLDRPVPSSQRPHSSAEEDKENFNDPSASNESAAAGSHDRLAQVLAFPETLSQLDGPLSKESADTHQYGSNQYGQSHRSSQSFVVKDSQQSPKTKENENHEYSPNKEQKEGQSRNHSGAQTDPRSDLEKVPSSPIMKPPLRSSPPSAHRRDTPEIENSFDFANKQPEDIPDRPPRRRHTSKSASQKLLDATGPLDTSSSVISQIAETPADRRPNSSRDMAVAPSIPETSPNRWQGQTFPSEGNGEAQSPEDDDLPPMYPPSERASQSRPSDAQRSLLAARKALNADILSSPSGRQRRALTEIAADLSPQTGYNNYNVDIGILTADDQEFSSMVAASPIPPRKKRRRNIGRSVFASDPVLPMKSLTAKDESADAQPETIEEEEPGPEEPATTTETTPRASSNPLKRDSFVSQVVAQQSSVRRVGRPPNSSKRRGRGRPPGSTRKHPPTDTVAVVIHNSQSFSSSRSPSVADQSPMDTSVDVPDTDFGPSGPDGSQILLNQVIGVWSGSKRAYYPGTCFGAPAGITPSRYLVKFEDSGAVEVPMSAVKRLELHIGDGVKVDMPDVPKITHIIRGFSNKLSPQDFDNQVARGKIPITDIYGHSTVILGPKQRKSLPGGGLAGPESVISVPLSKIYMDTILFNQLKDREFIYNSETVSESVRRTPSERHSTPTSPSTRLARNIHPFTGLFSGMAFAVSYVENENAKSRITRLVLENGGRILKDGFNELFEYTANVPLAESSDPNSTPTSEPFHLASAAEEIGFACLIADKHSRREKYMQALALNLPCISGRWVDDCAAQSRVLDWGMYLLPAGESLYLDGATKSRLLNPVPAQSSRLSDTIAGRPNLLNGQSVLLVMGKGRAEEKRKAYIFLTYALGASKVERVFDLKSARTVLEQQAASGVDRDWDWISVDDDEQDAAQAMILGGSDEPQKPQPARRGRKRKRPGPVGSRDCVPSVNTKARIMGNEFLCQSLILGRLFE